MALIGLKYMAAAKAAYADGGVTFSEGMLIGKAISVDKSIDFNDVKLHADNELAVLGFSARISFIWIFLSKNFIFLLTYPIK